MAITFVNAVANKNSGTSATGTFPASIAAGDFLVAAIVAASYSTEPSGWDLRATAGTLRVYTRFYQSGDGVPAWTVGSGNWIVGISAYHGVDTTTPVRSGTVGTSGPSWAQSSSVTSNGVQAGDTLVYAAATTDQSYTSSPPGTMQERIDTTQGRALTLCDEIGVGSGGNLARANTWSGWNNMLGAMLALVEATGGGDVALSAALSGTGGMAAALTVTGGGTVALSAALSGVGGMAAALTVEAPGTAVPIISAPTSGPVEYYIRWKSAAGATRAIIAGATGAGGRNGFLSLTYRKEVNRPGRFGVVLPFEHPALEQFADKDQVEIWRRHPAAGIDWYRDFSGVFRIEDLAEQQDGRILATLSGPGALARLGWYHILWPADVANRTAFASAKAETIMKTLVSSNAVAATATVAAGRDRQAPDYGVSVAADAAGGNTVSWNCGQRRNLLVELQELQRVAGGDLDLVRTGANSWEFRFYAGQRGTDKSATLVFARERGNLAGLRYTRNREIERTAALIGGQGEGAVRRTRTRTGAGYSAANDVETFVDARQALTDAELDAAGDAALDAAAARDQFTATLIQTVGCRYGPAPGHFELGDLATVFYPRVGAVVQQISAIEVRYAPGQSPVEQVRGEFTTL